MARPAGLTTKRKQELLSGHPGHKGSLKQRFLDGTSGSSGVCFVTCGRTVSSTPPLVSGYKLPCSLTTVLFFFHSLQQLLKRDRI